MLCIIQYVVYQWFEDYKRFATILVFSVKVVLKRNIVQNLMAKQLCLLNQLYHKVCRIMDIRHAARSVVSTKINWHFGIQSFWNEKYNFLFTVERRLRKCNCVTVLKYNNSFRFFTEHGAMNNNNAPFYCDTAKQSTGWGYIMQLIVSWRPNERQNCIWTLCI